MSASHLRPRSATELIDAAVQLARAHYGPLVVLSAIVALPGLVINVINARMLPPPGSPASFTAFWTFLPLTLVGLCWLFVGFGALIASVSAAYLTGTPAEPAAALRQAFARAGPLLAGNLIAYVVMFSGFLVTLAAVSILTPAILRGAGGSLALAVGLILLAGLIGSLVWLAVTLPRYANVTPAVMLEGAGPIAAVRRSRELARGSARRVLGILLLMFAIVIALTLVLSQVISELLDNRVLASALSGFLVIPVYPGLAAVLTLLYYDLRIRREGYDIELMAEGLGGPVGGPPAGDATVRQPSF